jgi:condensin-2 complex subunit D3
MDVLPHLPYNHGGWRLAQALLKDTLELPAGVGDEASGVRKVTVPADVRAHAWTALGKACLVDEPLAKRTLPFFVQQLQACDAAAVRNNILVALADLCTRYTGLVEPHAGRLAACLRDRCVVIRRHALLLLATLLSRDFLKWRGLLFQRFLLALVDESPHIRQLADYLLGDALATKAPLLAYNHFVEALFMLNDCRLHPSYTSSGAIACLPAISRSVPDASSPMGAMVQSHTA